MSDWTVFTAVTLVLLTVILALTWNTTKVFRDESQLSINQLSTRALFANVVITQGGFAVILVLLIIWTNIPWETVGVTVPDNWIRLVAIGTVLGVGLYLANVTIAANLSSVGIDYNEGLRASLTPESYAGWAMLLIVVLPLIAGFEELLFRGVLIGGFEAGYAINPWVLVVASSFVFALGHGIQGHGGIIVTGLLGVILGAVFVITGSLLVVAIAHYIINALEFLVNEAADIDTDKRLQVRAKSG